MVTTTIPLETVREELQTRTKAMSAEKLIESTRDVADRLLTPELVERARESGFYFPNTPDWRAEAAQKRKVWYAKNP